MTMQDLRNRRRGALRASAGLLLAGALLPMGCAAPASHPRHFDLTEVVPDDVFLVTGGRHNPDRRFLEEAWRGVWNRLLESGVPDDVLQLVLGAADEDQRAEIDRVVARFTDLLAPVDWDALGAGQFVFAERLPPPVAFGEGPAIASQPDMLFLLRTDPDLTLRSHEQLVALMEAAVDEISSLAGVPLTTRPVTLHGVSFTVFDVLQAVRDAPEWPIALGRHGDVLLLTFGAEMMSDAAALLDGAEGHHPITDDPRFRAAFAALPSPDDAFEFVDMQRLRQDLELIAGNILGLIRNATSGSYDDRITNVGTDDEAVLLRGQGYAAYEQGDYERALKLTEAAHEVDPTDCIALYNIACLHALLDHREEAGTWLQKAVDAGFHAPQRIAEDVDLDGVRDEPGYLSAMAAAREEAQAWGGQGLTAAEAIIGRLLGSLGVLDFTAAVHRTQGHATWSESTATLTEAAPEQPFHAVLAGHRPLRPFLHRLPVETASFSATGGMDLERLYDFARGTLAEAGPFGEHLLERWEAAQSDWGFDLRDDLLGPLGSELISADLRSDGRDAWVAMLSVDDEQAVAVQLGRLLDELPARLIAMSSELPMLSMLGLRVNPTGHADLQGFREVVIGIAQTGMICGVSDGWLIAADSAATVRLMRETAAGRHPDLRSNPGRIGKALLPDGPAMRVSYTDLGNKAAEAAGVLRMLSAMGGMLGAAVPEPEVKQVIGRVFGMLSRLAPVVEAIDFYDSTATWTTFDGRTWHTRSVTRYVPPAAQG